MADAGEPRAAPTIGKVALAALGVSALLWLAVLAAQIIEVGQVRSVEKADVAIVLGAAIQGDRPSPVFEERIKHGIALFKAGTARKLLFTGGTGEGARLAESLVAARYAVHHGVPPQAIMAEVLSHTTQENLLHARRVMRANGLRTALIVTDPLHEKRALRMASDLGISAHAAPTPTSRYRSWHAKTRFLIRELYFYNHYLVTGR